MKNVSKRKRKAALLLSGVMALSMVLFAACAGGYPTEAPSALPRSSRSPLEEPAVIPINASDESHLLGMSARAGRDGAPAFRGDECRTSAWWWPTLGGETERALVFWEEGHSAFWEVQVHGNANVDMILQYHAMYWEGGTGTITINRVDENGAVGEVFQEFEFTIPPGRESEEAPTWERIQFRGGDYRFRWPAGLYRVTITADSVENRSLMTFNRLSFLRV